MYLLICEPTDIEAVQADIVAEVAVQFGTEAQSLVASPLSLSNVFLEASELRQRTADYFTHLAKWEQSSSTRSAPKHCPNSQRRPCAAFG